VAAAGAGLGPGAVTEATVVQFPDWHPSPQWLVVLPQYPYIEQQLPFGQLPQTVPPFEEPQVPSVVTTEVAVEDAGAVVVTAPMTGSPVVVDEGGLLEAVSVEAEPAELELPSVQPL
jgi:hypothetical protein